MTTEEKNRLSRKIRVLEAEIESLKRNPNSNLATGCPQKTPPKKRSNKVLQEDFHLVPRIPRRRDLLANKGAQLGKLDDELRTLDEQLASLQIEIEEAQLIDSKCADPIVRRLQLLQDVDETTYIWAANELLNTLEELRYSIGEDDEAHEASCASDEKRAGETGEPSNRKR